MKKLMTAAWMTVVVAFLTHSAWAAEDPKPDSGSSKDTAKAADASKDKSDEKADDATADATTLHFADPAPALEPSKWVKGKEVASFEPGKIYVVEFWATWCGPCKASIPHLTKLQKEYPQVTIIGVDTKEQDSSAVPDFLQKMGDKMDYRVALDEKEKMQKSWMEAAGQNGIPCAFVVGKDTKIAWIGHPMELDDVIKEVVAGSFDVKKAAAKAAAMKIVAAGVNKAVEAGDLEAVEKLAKDYPDFADDLVQVKWAILLQKKDFTAITALAKELVKSHKDNPELLNMIAWTMVDPETPFENPDLELALKAARRANEVAKGERYDVLDTLARVYYVYGDIDRAIEYQTKSIAKADDDAKEEMTKTLDEYKAKKDGTK